MWIDSNGSVNVLTNGDDVWAAASSELLGRLRALSRKELKVVDRLVSEFWTEQIEALEGSDFDETEERKWVDLTLPRDVIIVDTPASLIDTVQEQLIATPRRWQVDLAQAFMMIVERVRSGE